MHVSHMDRKLLALEGDMHVRYAHMIMLGWYIRVRMYMCTYVYSYMCLHRDRRGPAG